MLWVLIDMLSWIEELWFLVHNVRLLQSDWHGWTLACMSSQLMTHSKTKSTKNDPFRMTLIR